LLVSTYNGKHSFSFFFCRLFNTISSNGMTGNEWERIWKEAVVAQLGYNPGICLKGLRKTTTNIRQESRCPGLNSNQVPPEHKSRVLPPRHLCSVRITSHKPPTELLVTFSAIYDNGNAQRCPTLQRTSAGSNSHNCVPMYTSGSHVLPSRGLLTKSRTLNKEKITVFWNAAPCGLVYHYRQLRPITASPIIDHCQI
jgi:hypothetical protein